jgi:hypothetical protein
MNADYCLDLRPAGGSNLQSVRGSTYWTRCGECAGCLVSQAREEAAATAAGPEPGLAPPSVADYPA